MPFAAFQAYGVWPPPIFPSHSWFAITGGAGGLGIATASWLATQARPKLDLFSVGFGSFFLFGWYFRLIFDVFGCLMLHYVSCFIFS